MCSIRPAKAWRTRTTPPGRSTRPSSAAAASRSSRWCTTVDTQAQATTPSRRGSRSARPATQRTAGCGWARAAWARIPSDGSTATTSTPNQPAMAAANCPVPAPRSSTGDRRATSSGSQGRIACRQGSIPSGGRALGLWDGSAAAAGQVEEDAGAEGEQQEGPDPLEPQGLVGAADEEQQAEAGEGEPEGQRDGVKVVGGHGFFWGEGVAGGQGASVGGGAGMGRPLRVSSNGPVPWNGRGSL